MKARSLSRSVLVSLAGFLLSACSVNLNKESRASFVRNQCTADADCGKGTCHSGVCVAHEGAFSTLLIAVTPPLAAVGVGGVRFLQVETDLQRSSDDTKIDLSPTTQVHGFVSAPAGCGVSVPVQVTLTPREEGYGLPVVRYIAKTSKPASLEANNPCYGRVKDSQNLVDEFVLSIPVVTSSLVKCGYGAENKACYDVYVEPRPLDATSGDGGAGADDCAVVPQYLPNRAVDACFAIIPVPPQILHVVIPWAPGATGLSSLDGWAIDVVHPLSGHVLSNRGTLRERDAAGAYNVDVRYAPATDDTQGKELVRLTPPPRVVAPVIEAELSALQATDTTRAVFPEFGPFPAAVPLESWVWESADAPTPVPGTVELTAIKDGDQPALDGIKPGIFASFSTSVVVGDDGKLRAVLPPGHYRARTIPRAPPLPGSGRSAAESTLDVACDHDSTNAARCAPADPAHPPSPRAGNVLSVPKAAKISGEVVQAIDGVSVGAAAVYAEPAAFNARKCATNEGVTCSGPPLGVLDLSLGEDAFVPRAVSAPVLGGRFELLDVDCGACSNLPDGRVSFDAGASFDLSVRPPDGSRLPWLIRPGVFVATDRSVGKLPLSLPIVHRGVVQIPQKDSEPLVVPRALIQAYVMRDDTGTVITSPTGLGSCTGPATGSAAKPAVRCIRSVLQIAETRAAEDGTFELVLPSELQTGAPEPQ